MVEYLPPIPESETKRLLELSRLDLDYSAIENNFRGFTELAAKITGAPVSLINLIDSFTQWTIAEHGLPLRSMAREDSVCQYTIMDGTDHFEVNDLKADDRFKDKFYVNGPDGFNYYLGVPLRKEGGDSIGALCILNTEKQKLSDEKIDLLKKIAAEIVHKLEDLEKNHELSKRVATLQEKNKALARNVAEPLAGILGILGVMVDRGGDIETNELLDYVTLMQKSGEIILQHTIAAIDADEGKHHEGAENLLWLKGTIEKLYVAICEKKKIQLHVSTSARTENITFSPNLVLQIVGNLVAYAIRHTPASGSIDVNLVLKIEADGQKLSFDIAYPCPDTEARLAANIFARDNGSVNATGQQVLILVKKLVNDLNGQIDAGTTADLKNRFTVTIVQKQQ